MTATGVFRTNGVGGTVTYEWIRKDSKGTKLVTEPAILIAGGDTSAHAVLSDSWVPSGPGSEQLFFTSPSFAVAPQSFTCR